MGELTIDDVLRNRGVCLKGHKHDVTEALERAALSQLIAADYSKFEGLRDALLHIELAVSPGVLESLANIKGCAGLLNLMLECELISPTPTGHYLVPAQAKRYLSGGWLEELAWLAAMSAGADEAIYGQVLSWEVKGYAGENEIDLIMRRGAALSFVSCKALRSELDMRDKKQRNRLMDAVHEADNLVDHFGGSGDKVAVLVTTDLYDEARDTARYHALMGKAAILDVRLIALEELHWDRLVLAFRDILPTATD